MKSKYLPINSSRSLRFSLLKGKIKIGPIDSFVEVKLDPPKHDAKTVY